MSYPDTATVADIVRDVAASEIVPRFQNLTAEDIREKKPGDLVTVADEAAEEALTRRLSALLPGSLVVGEEAVAANPAVLELLKSKAPVWVIDPVDGTINFAQGRPEFAVLLALVQDGRTLAGWIYDPIAGRMAMAEEGGGAWLDGARLHVTHGAARSDLRGLIGANAHRRKLEGQVGPGKLVGSLGALRCAGQEYLSLLTGAADFTAYRRIMPWDHAAGALLYREAGGQAALLSTGESYAPTTLSGGLLLAPDLGSWSALRALLTTE
jgi:fructose-1,6-bisphosphatase/inositol monophosphatase family enzyme